MFRAPAFVKCRRRYFRDGDLGGESPFVGSLDEGKSLLHIVALEQRILSASARERGQTETKQIQSHALDYARRSPAVLVHAHRLLDLLPALLFGLRCVDVGPAFLPGDLGV